MAQAQPSMKARYYTIVLLLLISIGVSLFGVSRLRLESSGEEYLTQDKQALFEWKSQKVFFSDDPSLQIIIYKKNTGKESQPWTNGDLCRLYPIYKELENRSLSSFSILSVRKLQVDGNRIHYPLVLEPCSSKQPDLSNRHFQGYRGTILAQNPQSPWIDLFVELTLTRNPATGDLNMADLEDLKTVLKNLPSDFLYHLYGTAFLSASLKDSQNQILILNTISILGLSLLFYFFYRSLKSIFVFLIPFTLAVIWVHGLMGLLGYKLNTLSFSLFSLILLSGLEDFMFISSSQIKNSRLGSNHVSEWKRPFQTLAIPGFLTSATTALGFGALLTSDLSIVRDFGMWASMGAIFEWVVTFKVLPILLEANPSLRNWTNERSPWFSKQDLLRILPRLPRIQTFWIGLLFLPFSMISFQYFKQRNIPVNSRPLKNFVNTHPFSLTVEYLKKTRGWEASIPLLIDRNQVSDRQRSDILAQVKDYKTVQAIESGDPFLDSLTKDYVETSQTKLQSQSHLQLIHREFKNSPFGRRYYSPLNFERIFIYLSDASIQNIHSLRETLSKKLGERGFLTGVLPHYAENGLKILTTLIESAPLTLGLLVFSLFYLCIYRRIPLRQGCLFSLCSLWGSTCLFLGIWIIEGSFNLIACIVFSILLGLTGDNLIQFLSATPRRSSIRKGIEELGLASLQYTGALVVVVTPYFFSDLVDLRRLSIYITCGSLLSWFGDTILSYYLSDPTPD